MTISTKEITLSNSATLIMHQPSYEYSIELRDTQMEVAQRIYNIKLAKDLSENSTAEEIENIMKSPLSALDAKSIRNATFKAFNTSVYKVGGVEYAFNAELFNIVLEARKVHDEIMNACATYNSDFF